MLTFTTQPAASRAPTLDEVTEVSVLLPGWQASALESAAHDRGLTTGEMVRRLVREFLFENQPSISAH